MKKIISIALVIVVVGLLMGGAFYGGMKYKEQGIGQERQQKFQQMGASATGAVNGKLGNQLGSSFITGEIISKDEKSINVKLQDGSSKIIFFSDTTEINKFITGSSSDLEVGKTITISGKENQEGSITAQSIQLRSEGIKLP